MAGLDPAIQFLDTSEINEHKSPMRATTYNDFRKNLDGNFDKVNDDWEPVIITRSNDKPSAVLISSDHYEALHRKLDKT
jgi:prevent-host-death family protein